MLAPYATISKSESTKSVFGGALPGDQGMGSRRGSLQRSPDPVVRWGEDTSPILLPKCLPCLIFFAKVKVSRINTAQYATV